MAYPDCERLDRPGYIEFYRDHGLPEPSTHYAVELPGGIQLLVLDSNLTLEELTAAGEPVSHQDDGSLDPAQLAWLEGRLSESRRTGRLPLVAVHHTVMEHPAIPPGYTWNNSEIG